MARIRKSLLYSKSLQWKIGLYLRLSKEDGNDESLSVANQRKILTDYLQNNWNKEDYALIDTYIDDGLTGTDINRKNFQRMKRDIMDGKINCIIVKSLARAFRNLADQQKFLEEFLPLYKVRFINLGTPFIDTFINPEAVNGFEVPIRGMFNEQFAAATSEEIRKTFNMKRSRGEFIGSFAPYGYQKNPTNKNQLLIDEEAAYVVKDIFTWFLYGMSGVNSQGSLSINSIAKELNERGVLSPISYKKKKGLKYCNPNSRFNDNAWSPTTVSNILKNRVYTGCMVQGKQRVISYKIHKQINIPENEWFIKENTHEPIIDSELFKEVQYRLLRDTRTAPGQRTVHLFSGFLKCGDCGRALHRKSSKGHTYYYCRFGKHDHQIYRSHSIREDTLKQIVLSILQSQISLIEDLSQIIDKINRAPTIQNHTERLNTTFNKQKQELIKLTSISDSLYTDWKSGILSKEEYLRMKVNYENKIQHLVEVLEKIHTERQLMLQGITTENLYFANFRKYGNITVLNHEVLVDFIDVISLYPDGSLEIKFNFTDQFQRIIEYINITDNTLR